MADTWVDILTAEHEVAADPHPQYQLAVDLSFKKAVRAVATTNVASLSGTTTIDGVSLVAADRVLLVGQSTGADNGIYAVAAGAWSRATDLNTSAEFHTGLAVPVGEGTVGAGKIYYFANTGAFTLGSTAQTWTSIGYQATAEKDVASGYQGLNSAGVANGSYANHYLSPFATHNVVAGDRGKILLVNTGGGNRTVNLPAFATAGIGFVIGVKKITSDANTVTVDGDSSDLIDGSATHVLTAYNQVAWYFCDGTNWEIIGEGGTGGGSGITAALISRTVYTTGSGATHTPSGSAQMVRVICVGAGGGGGGAAQGGGQSGVSGGGGSGGITEKWWTPSGNITYTVGVFGAKGAAGNNAGTAGTDTTASGTSLALTAKGGNGGASMAFGTTHIAALGGGVNAGTTGGDFDVPTGVGGTGVRQGGTLGISGNGANCGNYGHGGAGGQVNTAGLNGVGYGAGGGGAHANGAGGVDRAGGDGAGGLVIIEEYY